MENRISGALCAAVGLAVIVLTMSSSVPDLMGDPGPLLLPRIIGIVMIALGLMLFFASSAESGNDEVDGSETNLRLRFKENRQPIAFSLAVVGYAVLFNFTGFFWSTACFLFSTVLILNMVFTIKSVAAALAFAVLVPLLTGAALLHWLDIPLPGTLI